MSYWMCEVKSIDCPFCGKNIVTDYEQTDECEKDDKPEVGMKIVHDDECFRRINDCDHVAFMSYGDGELEVKREHKAKLISIARTLVEDQNPPYKESAIESEFSNILEENFDDVCMDDVVTEEMYVEAGQGPHGGGPTYRIIFIG